jgi:hypothetical protein
MLTGGRRSDALIETRENDWDREERERWSIEIYAVMPGKPDGREEEEEFQFWVMRKQQQVIINIKY